MTPATITVDELHRRRLTHPDTTVIDVRTPAEFRALHARGAVHHPLDKLDPQAITATCQPSPDKPVHVLCKSGQRAAMACQKLSAAGCTDVVCVTGGTDAWAAAGYDVERSAKPVMSLERQVRIAAGCLVLTGTVLGATVSPWCYLLPGFVGAGLMFAGITDTCAMGMAIAKMPWNR